MTDEINKQFRNSSEVGEEVFNYLGAVREEDGEDNVHYTPDEELPEDDKDSRIPGNRHTGTLTTKIDHIPSDLPAYDGHRDLGNITIMPRPMQRKSASTQPTATGTAQVPTQTSAQSTNTQDSSWLSSLGKTKLSDIEGFRRKMFLNSPILESMAVGGLAGLGVYALAPWFMRRGGFDPLRDERGRIIRDPKTGEPLYVDPKDRKYSALAVGLGIGALNMLRGVQWGKDFEWSQLYRMPKRASMLGPVDYVPTQFALNAVTLDPNIPDNLKYNTLHALGTIDQPLINSTDMVNAGINSGVSGSTGFPVGRIAAASVADALTAYGVGKLTGVPNPGTLATSVGTLSALGRVIANSF